MEVFGGSRSRAGLAALALLFAACCVGPAGGAPEKAITGAHYTFLAAGGATSLAKGSGDLRKSGQFLAVVRGREGARTFASRVRLWSIDRRTPTDAPRVPRTTLVLRVEVTSSIGGCRTGTRGTVTLVDWNTKLANGRTADRVKVRFPAGSCHALGGAWSNVERRDRVRVSITVRR